MDHRIGSFDYRKFERISMAGVVHIDLNRATRHRIVAFDRYIGWRRGILSAHDIASFAQRIILVEPVFPQQHKFTAYELQHIRICVYCFSGLTHFGGNTSFASWTGKLLVSRLRGLEYKNMILAVRTFLLIFLSDLKIRSETYRLDLREVGCRWRRRYFLRRFSGDFHAHFLPAMGTRNRIHPCFFGTFQFYLLSALRIDAFKHQ